MTKKQKKHSKETHKVHKHIPKAPKKVDIPYQTVAVILGLLFIVSLFTGGFGLKIGAMNKDKAAKKAVDYVNTNLLSEGATAVIRDTAVKGDLYNIKLEIGGREYDSYMTKDGKLFFPSAIELEPETEETTVPETPEVTKSDKPDVKLFVMSYCPYGLQAMKALIPAREVLKDKADITINFVDYAMHGKREMDENLRMYCAQEQDKDKFWDYLTCFVQTDDAATCLDEAGLDKVKIGSCVEKEDVKYKVTELFNDQSTWLSGRYPQFNLEKDLNDKYGVQGSPTTVINDKVVSVARSAKGYLDAICNAFNKKPGECDAELSTGAAAPGIGSLDAASTPQAAAAAAAQCS